VGVVAPSGRASCGVAARLSDSMPEFRYNFKLECPVDPSLAESFVDVLQNLQMGMQRIAQEQNRTRVGTDQMRQDNDSLRGQNDALRRELAQLRGNASGGGGALAHEAPAERADHRAHTAPIGTAAGGGEEGFDLERVIKIHDAPVHSVAMAPKGEVVATASWDATSKLYNLATDEVVATLGSEENRMGGLYSVMFAKTHHDILGCTSCDRSVYLWNHTTGRMVLKLDGHSDEVNGIDFHSSQQVMVTASDDNKAIIWDFQEGITLRTLDKHTKAVYGATFLGNDSQYCVATCCFDQKARVFDMRDKQIVALLQTHRDDVIGIAYAGPKQLLATGSDDGLIALWDTRTWKLQTTINTRENPGIPENEVKRVSFSPDGHLLAAACSSGKVLVYDIRGHTPTVYAQLGGHTDCVFDVTWGTDPQTNTRTLVSASHDQTCRYWRDRMSFE